MGLFDEETGDLITYWKTKTTITDLVGTGTGAKIWPELPSQGMAAPFVFFTKAGGEVFTHQPGQSGARISAIHVYCFGSLPSQRDALATAIYNSLCKPMYRGTMGGSTIMRVYCTDPPDDGYDRPNDDSDTKRFWSRYVFRIAHNE